MEDSLRDLFEGNDRHVERVADSFAGLGETQHPEVVTVSCGDSRVLQDEMWDSNRPGRVFTHSNIGNRVRQQTDEGYVVAGDVLYPLVHTGTDTVIVVGHTGCGAVTAAYHDLQEGLDEPPGIDYCVNLLELDLEAALDRLPAGLNDDDAINRLVEYNVDRQIDFLVESEDVPDRVTVFGVVYDFHDVYSARRGAVHLVNVDGTRDPDRLVELYPELTDRIQRLWEY